MCFRGGGNCGLIKPFKGFTLAEVLITLGIIGVVAAMTMPVLMGNYRKSQTIAQLKKAYSVLGQAYEHAIAEYGDSSNWDNITPETAFNYFDTYWKPYLFTKDRCYRYDECGYKKLTPFLKSNRSADAYWVSPDAGTASSRVLMFLNDGTFVMIITSSGYGKDDRRILVDLNGPKPPNRFGNDVFFFLRIPDKGIVPYGYDKTMSEINNDCSERGSGYMCSARIINSGWSINKGYPFN